ncbi:MAG: hypothetical protein RRY65_07940 [Pseudoflavonifractor sp.]
MAFDKVKYDNEFKKQSYDTIRALVPKGKAAVIKEYAKSKNKSTSQLIVESVEAHTGLDLSKSNP